MERNDINNKIVSVHVETKGEVWEWATNSTQTEVWSYHIIDKSMFKDRTASFSQIRYEDTET